MIPVQSRPLLALFLLLFTTNTCGHIAKIINQDDTPAHLKKFEFTFPEAGVTLQFKGKSEKNEFKFKIVFPSYDPLDLYVPKVITKENPIYTRNPKTGVIHPHGLVKTHNGRHKAHDVEQIKAFQDSLAPEKIIELPKSTIINNSLQKQKGAKTNPITQTFPDQTYDSNDYHYDSDNYSDPISAPSLAPEDNSWMPYIVGGSSTALFLVGYYYLTYNIAACIRYLSCVERWSSWKSSESFDTLLLVKPRYLANDLIKDINVTYYQETDPIGHFLSDLQEEYETILGWMQFRNIVSRLCIPLGEDFNMLEKRIQLLDNMRKAVHYWRAREMEKNST